MSEGSTAEEWLNFFLEAGVGKEAAETYAVTFSKNHMKLDMLSELNKDYLMEMGITCIGHIIGILRYAKTVHQATVTRSELLKKAEDVPVNECAEIKDKEFKSTKIVNKSTSATRMINHYLPKDNSVEGNESRNNSAPGSLVMKRSHPVSLQVPPKTQKVMHRLVVPEVKKEEYELEGHKSGREPINQPAQGKQWELGTTIPLNNKTKQMGANGRSSSVFSRLGNKTETEKEEKLEEKLSILRRISPTMTIKDTKTKVNPPDIGNSGLVSSGTMRADQPELPVHARTKPILSKQQSGNEDRMGSVKARLGAVSYMNGLSSGNVEEGGEVGSSYRREEERVREVRRLNPVTLVNQITNPCNLKVVKQEKLEEIKRNLRVNCLESPVRMEKPKKVSFGSVSQQLIPRRETRVPQIRPISPKDFKFLGSVGLGTGVFSRLGKH